MYHVFHVYLVSNRAFILFLQSHYRMRTWSVHPAVCLQQSPATAHRHLLDRRVAQLQDRPTGKATGPRPPTDSGTTQPTSASTAAASASAWSWSRISVESTRARWWWWRPHHLTRSFVRAWSTQLKTQPPREETTRLDRRRPQPFVHGSAAKSDSDVLDPAGQIQGVRSLYRDSQPR